MGQIDYTKVSKETLAKIRVAEQKKPTYLQLMALQDIAAITHELLVAVEDKDSMDKMGTLLVDIREHLQAIKAKDAPEVPDFSKPVVQAVDKLEKALTIAIKKIEVKPEVNVAAPNVQVDAPEVDLSGVEKILKKDLPKAFDDAVKKIPTTPAIKLTPLEKVIREGNDQIIEWLESIDHVSRKRTTFPGTMKVTNTDGTPVGGVVYSKPTSNYAIQAISETATDKYFFFEDPSNNWYVMRKTLATSVFAYTKGTGGYASVYVDSTTAPSGSLTYASYGNTF